MKKFISVLMTAALLLAITISMCVPAFAAEEPIYAPSKMLYTDSKGETYELFTSSYDLSKKTMTLTNATVRDKNSGVDNNTLEHCFFPSKNKNIQNIELLLEHRPYLFWKPVMEGKITKIVDNTSTIPQIITFSYDNQGRITGCVIKNSKGKELGSTRITYNKKGQISKVQDITIIDDLDDDGNPVRYDKEFDYTFNYDKKGSQVHICV